MADSKQYDYIVVGQGLAGTILSDTLQQKGASVAIIDNGFKSSSSLIAGGITHPMSFKKLIISWRALELLEFAEAYYKELESRLNHKIFDPQKMTRLFSSFEEQNLWETKVDLPPFNKVLSDKTPQLTAPIKSPYGSGSVYGAFRILLNRMLTAYRTKNETNILQEEFDFSQLKLSSNEVTYGNLIAKKIIFCEGYKYIDNPYFSYLPNNLTKGEILILNGKDLPNHMISRNIFVLPKDENSHILGATYRWNTTTTNKTEEAKEELLSKFKNIGDFNFQIQEHRVGIRPTIPDRKPLVGIQPNFSEIAIFNGMGSKGVMMAPYFANNFAEHLLNSSPIDEDVNIERFSKKHLSKFDINHLPKQQY